MGVLKEGTFYEKERKMTVVTRNLKDKYNEEVVKVLQEEFKYENVHQIPKLSKIVLNMGVGEACHNSKLA